MKKNEVKNMLKHHEKLAIDTFNTQPYLLWAQSVPSLNVLLFFLFVIVLWDCLFGFSWLVGFALSLDRAENI